MRPQSFRIAPRFWMLEFASPKDVLGFCLPDLRPNGFRVLEAYLGLLGTACCTQKEPQVFMGVCQVGLILGYGGMGLGEGFPNGQGFLVALLGLQATVLTE